MKKVLSLTKKQPQEPTRGFMGMLFNGKIMGSITDSDKSIGMWAKLTEIDLDNLFLYGMWLKFEDRWELLHFGELPKVEPKWSEFIEKMIKHGYIDGIIAA